ncbi:AAA family ATPase [Psychromonas algicola]|uniref:AAA family ATPase n=1 Tax=Psychromonas algicola TaxID=2555642 RepID=UPI001067F183|nr:AAA family ATPase [Psychromonas sp. RZ5]TEW51447.1 transcriptional regulator [Psychromonas sp. RZ5]
MTNVVRGFLLGKFMPFHKGHEFLCKVAMNRVDELIVLVCSRDIEPINGPLRYQWVKGALPDKVKVIHLHRDIPQEPKDHPDFWNIWRKTINDLVKGQIDYVFGSESYVHQLADELNAKPFIVDIERVTFPISGTKVRDDLTKYWQFLPSNVQASYRKRVCLLGAESVGKSTLCKMLSSRFDSQAIHEYGRTYDAEFKQGKDWEAENFIEIALGHIAIREETVSLSNYLCFEDTDLLQTMVWAKYLLGEIPSALHELLDHWQPADEYLLLSSEVNWVDDGTRYSGDLNIRNWFFCELKMLLETLQLNYQVIDSDNWESRQTQATKVVERVLSSLSVFK